MRALVTLCLAGCGSLDLGDGALQCSSDGACPEGYHCAEDRHCWRTGSEPSMFSCSGYLDCIGRCGNPDLLDACLADCRMRTSDAGTGLMDQVTLCLDGACPSASGGICDLATYNETACTACLSAAMASGGRCYAPLQACLAQ